MKGLIKIDNIMFRVKDLDVSARFYSEVFGLTEVWRDDESQMIGYIFPKSDSEIVIHTREDIPNPDFNFLVENVETFVREFKEKGYKVYKEPFDVRSGKLAVLSDPDGNIINVIDLSKFNNQSRFD